MSDCDARIFPLWDSLGKNTGVGCHVLVQEIFQTQGSHPCLLHCTWILNCWATQETVVLQVPYSHSFRQLGGNEELFLSLLGLSVSSSKQSKCRSGTFWGHVFSSPASPTTFISHQNLKKHVSTEKLYLRLQRLSINIIVLFCSYIPPQPPVVISTVYDGKKTQGSSAQSLSCVQLCDLMDCRMPHFPVHHHLELAQNHVHRVIDAIQPSHPLLFPSPPASLFPSIRVFSNESGLCIRWSKYWGFNFSISHSNDYSRLISLKMD